MILSLDDEDTLIIVMSDEVVKENTVVKRVP